MNDSVPVAPELSDESPSEPDVLPSVDELVRQVPAEARALLEELFRANFTTVRRVPPSALKSADAPGASGD
ncbi:MAG TPA: hypothetical protein VG710_03430 [Opitutus sp.]|nr:hypothetical protein [Opitutus sp.]